MSIEGITGALLFTGLGVAELAFVNRSVYPSLRWRYEKAKTTQTHGLSPAAIMALVKVQSLILLPLAGFMLGNGLASISG